MKAELEQATAAARHEVVRRLALTPRKEVFVFIHGVANQLDDAIIAAGQFWHFLGREGVPIIHTALKGLNALRQRILTLLKVPVTTYTTLRDRWWMFALE